MNFFCIVSCAILIATANAKPSTSAPNVDDESLDYYIDSEDNSLPLDQMDDASLPPRFLMEPETVTARDGESAILKCPVENAENYGQVWLKGQNTIANGNRSMQPDLYEVFPNRTLLIKNVKPSTTGYYSCTIYISNLKKASLTHKLKLQNGAEIVSLRAQNNITQLYNGDTLVLTCAVDGKPLPTIKWYFESSDQPSAREVSYGNHESNGYTDTLTIPDVSFKNNGTYKCLADNTINVDHQSIVIEVFDKGRDTATSDSQISAGLRLLPSLLLIAATAIVMNP